MPWIRTRSSPLLNWKLRTTRGVPVSPPIWKPPWGSGGCGVGGGAGPPADLETALGQRRVRVEVGVGVDAQQRELDAGDHDAVPLAGALGLPAGQLELVGGRLDGGAAPDRDDPVHVQRVLLVEVDHR